MVNILTTQKEKKKAKDYKKTFWGDDFFNLD
jgi:hypothetical protein